MTMQIFLTDSQKTIQYHDYPLQNPLQFMIKMKQMFPSVIDLVVPIMAEEIQHADELTGLTWESTAHDFVCFQRLVQEWMTLEMRFKILTQRLATDDLTAMLKSANQERLNFVSQQNKLHLLHGDYVFLHKLHTLIDIQLIELGEQFYVDKLKQAWQADIPAEILNRQVVV